MLSNLKQESPYRLISIEDIWNHILYSPCIDTLYVHEHLQSILKIYTEVTWIPKSSPYFINTLQFLLKIKVRFVVASKIHYKRAVKTLLFCVSQQGCQWEIPGRRNLVMVQPMLETEQHW